MNEQETLIVVIDKDPFLAELYGLELSDMGYEVLTTSDVVSAQELIASCKPDLLLVDPYDGNEYRWDVLAEIRNRYVRLPILVCLPLEILPENHNATHADGYIVKSFDVSSLVWKMQSLLTKDRKESW